MEKTEQTTFEQWAILELMGHRRMAGMVREQTIGGAAFIRIDVPATPAGPGFTQFYAPGAVYCITPTTEEIARAIAQRCYERPVQPYEIPALSAGTRRAAVPEGWDHVGGRDLDDEHDEEIATR